MPTSFSNQNTSRELQAARPATAVIPVGATEQCGPCLPCNVDALVADYCARHYARGLGAYLAPLLPYNTSQEHGAFAGTLSLSAGLMNAILTELVGELARQGCRRIVLVSPHGGSVWLPAFLRSINRERADTLVVSAQVGAERSRAKALAASGMPRRLELHGGVLTAATVSFLAPELVRPGTYGAEVDPKLQELAPYGRWEKLLPDGAWGRLTAEDAALDLAGMGRIYWETFVAAQFDELREHLLLAARLESQP
jgi:creatinine amidohydrolase